MTAPPDPLPSRWPPGSRQARLREARLYLIASLPPGASTTDLAALATVAAAVEGGVDIIQLRLKGVDTASRRRWLVALREVIGAALLIVNDDVEAVRDVHGAPLADGLHVGREDAERRGDGTGPEARARGLTRLRGLLGADLLLGTSTRSQAEVEAAATAGADHVGFGAMATSATKTDTARATASQLRRCVQRFPDLPIFPIGGLDPSNLTLVTDASCRRAAIGSAILHAGDPPGRPDAVRRAASRCRSLLEPRAS